jgi:hypothetical protein
MQKRPDMNLGGDSAKAEYLFSARSNVSELLSSQFRIGNARTEWQPAVFRAV